jgi:hypothetical protein
MCAVKRSFVADLYLLMETVFVFSGAGHKLLTSIDILSPAQSPRLFLLPGTTTPVPQ